MSSSIPRRPATRSGCCSCRARGPSSSPPAATHRAWAPSPGWSKHNAMYADAVRRAHRPVPHQAGPGHPCATSALSEIERTFASSPRSACGRLRRGQRGAPGSAGDEPIARPCGRGRRGDRGHACPIAALPRDIVGSQAGQCGRRRRTRALFTPASEVAATEVRPSPRSPALPWRPWWTRSSATATGS